MENLHAIRDKQMITAITVLPETSRRIRWLLDRS